jgi:hypothetical protein
VLVLCVKSMGLATLRQRALYTRFQPWTFRSLLEVVNHVCNRIFVWAGGLVGLCLGLYHSWIHLRLAGLTMLDQYQFEITVSGVGSCESEALENALDGLCPENANAEVIRVTPIMENDDDNG